MDARAVLAVLFQKLDSPSAGEVIINSSHSAKDALVLFNLGARQPGLELFLLDMLGLSAEKEATVLDQVVFVALEEVVH